MNFYTVLNSQAALLPPVNLFSINDSGNEWVHISSPEKAFLVSEIL